MPKSGPIKRHGGKSYLAQKIRALMPKHTRYCEAFFGGGAVLLAGDGEGVAEYANDLDYDLTNFWSVLKNETLFKQFAFHVNSTPMSRVEFRRAKGTGIKFAECGEDVHEAVRFFILNRQSRQALGRDFATPTSRLRRGMNEQVSAWLSAVEGLPEFHARLKRVEIRCEDAKDFIKDLDSEETCFYCDPPYIHETRSSTGEYEHEMTVEQHLELLKVLGEIKGKFLLSGYQSSYYAHACSAYGWRRVDFEIPNQASSKREKEIKTECVWCNF